MEASSTLKKAAMEEGEKKGGCFASIGEDIHRDILSRLPASSFASATCVSRLWNRLCNQILSRPKLLSALSLNPRLQVAVKEVLDKILSEPIRPHFAIAYVGHKYGVKKAHELITESLGFRIPIVVSAARGIIGSDAVSNKFREVKWVLGDPEEVHNSHQNIDRGIVLIVGFVPGLKVSAIPLLRPIEGSPPPVSLIDKFVMDIKDYAADVSGCTSPAAILMFSDQDSDLKPVLDKMDYALSEETIIAGDENAYYSYSNGNDFGVVGGSKDYFSCKDTEWQIFQSRKCNAVAIVFAKDRASAPGNGEIHFHLALLTGVAPVGPMYKGASVRVTNDKQSTWLTARREGSIEKLDGQRMLDDFNDEIQNDLTSDLYIGVTRRRKYYIGSEKGRFVTSLAYHEIEGGDEEYLYVKGDGIKTGDSFCFYHPNPEVALTKCDNVYEEFKNLKQYWGSEGCHLVRGAVASGDRKEVFGGLIFSCYGRGESFFGRQHVDSSVFLENFPGVPLAGTFCCGEIGRGSTISNRDDTQDQNSRCHLHVYSTVYFVMLHTMNSSGQ